VIEVEEKKIRFLSTCSNSSRIYNEAPEITPTREKIYVQKNVNYNMQHQQQQQHLYLKVYIN